VEGSPSHLARSLLSGGGCGRRFHENDGKDEGKTLEIGAGAKVAKGFKERRDASCCCEEGGTRTLGWVSTRWARKEPSTNAANPDGGTVNATSAATADIPSEASRSRDPPDAAETAAAAAATAAAAVCAAAHTTADAATAGAPQSRFVCVAGFKCELRPGEPATIPDDDAEGWPGLDVSDGWPAVALQLLLWAGLYA